MSDLVNRLRFMSGDAGDRLLTREAADRIEELEGILHKVAEAQRKLSVAASAAHNATRVVNDMNMCGHLIELWDWYTFEEDD